MKKNLNDLDIRSLKYFTAAAEDLNFTSAAKKCFITQTAMSMHIAKMEEQLGFQLFQRGGRRVSLTSAGRIFFERAKVLIRQYDDTVALAAGIADGTQGILNVIFTSSLDALYFSSRFEAFHTDNPSIHLRIRIVEPREVDELLSQGEADLAFCWPYDYEKQNEYSVRTVDRSHVCAAMSSRHRLVEHYKSVSVKDLEDERVIVISEGGLPNSYHALREKVMELGLHPSSMIQVNKMEEILIHLELNDGIAILPRYIEEVIAPGRLKFFDINGTPPVTFDKAIISFIENNNAIIPEFLEYFPEV